MLNKRQSPGLIFFFLLLFLILNSQFLSATVRFVSHTGSNIPPYTSWETAADSIMSAINFSGFGDTIYVANGVYEEIVEMISGLTLIGAGMDSCIIKKPNDPYFYYGVALNDYCTIDGFVLINQQNNFDYGIFAYWCDSVEVKNIKIPNWNFGIEFITSSGLIKNCMLTNINRWGIWQDLSFSPSEEDLTIVNNIIETNYIGIELELSDSVDIISNIILLRGGYIGIKTDCINLNTNLFNNAIVSDITQPSALHGIDICSNFHIRNNFIINKYAGYSARLRTSNPSSDFINNVIMNGINPVNISNDSLVIHYSDFWMNGAIEYPAVFVLDSTNLSVDPMIINEDTAQGVLDFHLQMFSPLIDAGDPNILDIDGSRSDIGLYGGPFGERYEYLDLAPKPPRNLTAEIDSIIILTWNRNTEADFNHYNLYRDTTANFTIDSTKLVASLEDTFYIHIIPAGTESIYFKLTGVDNQGNESNPSEELHIIITSANENPQTVSNYQLYQNYPNPFNPSTTIGYKLKERGYVKLMIYDIKGELVSVLVNHVLDAGYYEVNFDVKSQLASGIYIYQIMVRSENDIPVFSDIKKMLMIK